MLDALAQLDVDPAREPEVNITVDDGNRSDVGVLAPALVERGLVGTFFVCAGRLGVDSFLDASDLRRLGEMGMRVGTHGMNHVSWRGLSDDRLGVEIFDAKAKLEDAMGARVLEAACPFGEYDRRALRMLAESGIERVFTSDRAGGAGG
jgi:peptidoglycan/xylan/chitin deacetylase (PgdA/CDA1 family)